ncbi:hypothetical protein ACD591_17355 [Rufibacter glacialis]|uniref:Fumarate hydratase n=1 Tax=Rufibacter glacialis TaxID=1259555 RepID=A0A5M8QEB4_9BACT|nr:hypothetical protein [Rufibacter glacialis]KAA6434349.1 hypothetical protein FOE74_09090 [Rufibacter glacialis]GGK68768.1 hypothetical protein GCM10011405_16110 [Rufibacter glacialis]
METEAKTIAVLTGDIVESTLLSATERTRLNQALTQGLTTLVGKDQHEIFRGDSFQILLEDPSLALKTALQVRCLLRKSLISDQLQQDVTQEKTEGIENKKANPLLYSYKKEVVDARIAIGLGKTGYKSPHIRTSDGEAFQLSGRALDSLKSKGPRLVVATPHQEFNAYQEVICSFLDVFINSWSLQQAEVVFELLEGKKQQEIAEMLHISQASVSQRTTTAHWQEVEKALALFQKKTQQLF